MAAFTWTGWQPSLEYARNNQGILSDLKEANKTIAQLKLEILHIKNNQFEMAQQIENATTKITQLLLNLEDSTTEIARLTHLLNNNDG